MRRVRVLINPKSGTGQSFRVLREAMDRFWEGPETFVSYQFMQGPADGVRKARMAVEDGTDTVLVVGGDGTVSTVGRVLVGHDTALGVIPAGSGNGFARHFELDLRIGKAVEQLAKGKAQRIDVGVVNGMPFFVTCSMAWDAAIVRTFEKYPVRGIVPYVFAGVQEFFEYKYQDMQVVFDDDGEKLLLKKPFLLTVANLTQFGGGAVIAPHAKEDDGQLEFVGCLQKDFPVVLANVRRLFDGSIQRMPQVVMRSASSFRIMREHGAPIQVDGELVEADDPTVEITVRPKSLRVLVPHTAGEGTN